MTPQIARKASTTYYPTLHLEIARYIAFATNAGYDLPWSVAKLVGPPPAALAKPPSPPPSASSHSSSYPSSSSLSHLLASSSNPQASSANAMLPPPSPHSNANARSSPRNSYLGTPTGRSFVVPDSAGSPRRGHVRSQSAFPAGSGGSAFPGSTSGGPQLPSPRKITPLHFG